MSEILSRFEIAQQIPAQESFIMLDRVMIESPTKIVGLKAVSLGEWFFQGKKSNNCIRRTSFCIY